MKFDDFIREALPQVTRPSIEGCLKLLAEGATVPFIARYRKAQTGNLNEVEIQKILELSEKWDEILNRQKFIAAEVEKTGKLSGEPLKEFQSKILSTFDLDRLEDLYLPYKVKRKTKAQKARDAGLTELADWIWDVGHGNKKPEEGQSLEIWAFTFRNEAHAILTAEDAIQGACDLVTERLSEDLSLRTLVREQFWNLGFLSCEKGAKAKPNSKFDKYFTFEEKLESLLKPSSSHRYLAARRGVHEEELTWALGSSRKELDPEKKHSDPMIESLVQRAQAMARTESGTLVDSLLDECAKNAVKAYVVPAIETEIHRKLKDLADETACEVFGENVRTCLMQAPLGSKMVLGADPGIRSGIKLAVLDAMGTFLWNGVIYLQGEDQVQKSKDAVKVLIETYPIEAIAIGNGTFSRETESFFRGLLKELGKTSPMVVMVSEAGASVYSASEIAREEFPDLDVTVRGAISIARRLQDPLAELVKVDPKSIGVGQYQHDLPPSLLKRKLDFIVDSCVNEVGVHLNTASASLLSHVSGIGPGLARQIVQYRAENGAFKTRAQLLNVPRMSDKIFQQSAGFLRIPESDEPLENTGIHPESYPVLQKVFDETKTKVQNWLKENAKKLLELEVFKTQVDGFTQRDIVKELEKPGRDPRGVFERFEFREDIKEIKDVQVGMTCPGIVTNVTSFGAFVDIGVHQDGLVHLSQLSYKFIKDPREVVSPGDRVQIKVLEVNLEKNQLAFTMKLQEEQTEARTDRRSDFRSENRTENRNDFRSNQPSRGNGNSKPSGSKPVLIFPNSAGASAKPPAPKPNIRPAPQKQIFNNAFAGLAQMKEQLKGKSGK